jgi:parallel beta-helix repeat protein
MSIHEVTENDTPNGGRMIWNANDRELAYRIDALALNVKADPFGAAGDGAADDHDTIQAAIDACANAGGGSVFMPAGTYAVGKPLLLRPGVSLVGAGMYHTTIKLRDGVNRPVVTDESSGVLGATSFGQVHLSNFGIDGNRENNPRGQEGIFTTAYFSKFESLYIRNCGTHAIRMGFPDMSNYSSQNRVVGCRMHKCAGAGIYLDINAVDHTISENYISDCDHGIVINNGGVKVVGNTIFGHSSAGVEVTQTSYGSIITANDFNANKGCAIRVTRTDDAGTGPWSQILIAANSILGDALAANNQYDAICVTTEVPGGISKLTIVSNKIFALDGHTYRYGINLESNVQQVKCAGNHIQDVASGTYNVGPGCAHIEIDSAGAGPLAPPPIPRSGVPLDNPYHAPVTVYVSGGAVTSIAVGGRPTGITGGAVRLPAGQTIALTYAAPPTWTWFSD